MADDRIPLIDLAEYRSGAPGARERLGETIARTAEDTGFMLLANHGIQASLINRVFAAAAAFFDRELDFKLHHKIGDLNIGYLPNGAQVVRTSTINVNTKSNLRARPDINALIRSKISELYQGVKVIEFDHLSPDDP